MKTDLLLDSVTNSADLLNGFLAACSGLIGTVFLLRLFGKDEFEFLKVQIKLRDAWIVFAALTVGHAYLAYLVIGDCARIFLTIMASQLRPGLLSHRASSYSSTV